MKISVCRLHTTLIALVSFFFCIGVLRMDEAIAPRVAAQATAADDVGNTMLRELLLLLMEKRIQVTGSADLCNTRVTESNNSKGRAWYFAAGGCERSHMPAPQRVVTSILEGIPGLTTASTAARSRIAAALGELRQRATRNVLSLQQRLAVHTLAWEIVQGFRRIQDIDPTKAQEIDAEHRAAIDLLRLTAFSEKQLDALPKTLPQLPNLASAPEISPLVKRLNDESRVVELLMPAELHAELLFGRFTSRLFLTLESDDAAKLIRTRIAQTEYRNLQNLPAALRGLTAVFVLYFNVLSDDFKIVPTEQVAFWQQYSFLDLADTSLSFEEQAMRIEFVSIEFERNFESSLTDERLIYRKRDQKEMAVQGALNIGPLQAVA